MISSSLDGNNIISIPLETDEVMDLVYIYDSDKPMKEITKQYLENILVVTLYRRDFLNYSSLSYKNDDLSS